MGFAIRRGDICAVAAVGHWMKHKQTSHLRAFITAAAWAGALLLPSVWFFPSVVNLSPTYKPSEITFVAGALFGFGAFLNRSCVFGTIAHLANGETDYIGTLIGMFIGALLAQVVPFPPSSPLYLVNLSTPNVLTICIWAAFIAIAFHDIDLKHRFIASNNNMTPSGSAWSPFFSMSVIGAAGGLLHAIIGNWGYLTVLSHSAAKLINPAQPDVALQVFTATGSLILGAIVAARKTRKLIVRKPQPLPFFRKLAGGSLMSFSAEIIPGGNETLLLHGIPSLAPHALIAYAAMLVAVIGLFKLSHSA
ncbi:hypothetical protein SAMN05216604_10222 [Pseudomonas agarici]|nr:hypothetical protein SAMN05216604_10222 [Pseudomonas agarici]